MDDRAFRREAFHLAMYCLQSDLYVKDPDVREAVDNIIMETKDDIWYGNPPIKPNENVISK